MALIQSFRDLDVYKLARAEAKRILEVSSNFPKEERYSLTDQLRRSSRAVSAMIAEAWGRRRYIAAFINKIDEALSEAMETQAWLDHALDSCYIDTQLHTQLDQSWQYVGGMLSKMMDRAETFCSTAQKRN